MDIFHFHSYSTMKYLLNGFSYFTSNFQIKLASSNVLILDVEGRRKRREKGEQLKILKICIFPSLSVIYDF